MTEDTRTVSMIAHLRRLGVTVKVSEGNTTPTYSIGSGTRKVTGATFDQTLAAWITQLLQDCKMVAQLNDQAQQSLAVADRELGKLFRELYPVQVVDADTAHVGFLPHGSEEARP